MGRLLLLLSLFLKKLFTYFLSNSKLVTKIVSIYINLGRLAVLAQRCGVLLPMPLEWDLTEDFSKRCLSKLISLSNFSKNKNKEEETLVFFFWVTRKRRLFGNPPIIPTGQRASLPCDRHHYSTYRPNWSKLDRWDARFS